MVSPIKLGGEWLLDAEGWNPRMNVKDLLLNMRTLMKDPIVDESAVQLLCSGSCPERPENPEPGLCSSGMQIYLKTLDGKTLNVECASSDLVVNLKAEIREREGIPLHEQVLMFAGRCMKNSSPLSEYDIQHESTVHMVGGCRQGREINFLVDVELAQLWMSDRAAYEQTAAEWTRKYALDPSFGPIVTIPAEGLGLEGSMVTCVCFDGREICIPCGDPQQELAGSVRTLVAEQLSVPPRSVQLILRLSGGHAQLLQEADDALPLALVQLQQETLAQQQQETATSESM